MYEIDLTLTSLCGHLYLTIPQITNLEYQGQRTLKIFYKS